MSMSKLALAVHSRPFLVLLAVEILWQQIAITDNMPSGRMPIYNQQCCQQCTRALEYG